MQRVADSHEIDVAIEHEPTSGRASGEDESLWERLAIELVDDVRTELNGQSAPIASRFAGLRPKAALEVIERDFVEEENYGRAAPEGRSVTVDQDFDRGVTTYSFEDGSSIEMDDSNEVPWRARESRSPRRSVACSSQRPRRTLPRRFARPESMRRAMSARCGSSSTRWSR